MDLFSGCGGLSSGLRKAGFDVVACAEIRPEARDTYKLNYPEAVILKDIRFITANELLDTLQMGIGMLDLLAACPPCQGFSSLRTKKGAVADDPRNELIFEVLRLTTGLLPKCLLIENVPRLLQDDRLKKFKQKLEPLGYVFSEGVLDAQDYGVPQRRKRMILIGCRLGEIGLPPKLNRKRHVRDVLFGLPDPDSIHRRPLHRIRQSFTPIVQKRINSIRKNRSELSSDMVLECHRKYPCGFRDVYGRIAWDEVAPTITRSSHNPSKGRFIHPEDNRGLTLYESLLLQGFSGRYRFPKNLGIGHISSMIGEAFPPPMAQAQANHIRRKLETFEASKKCA